VRFLFLTREPRLHSMRRFAQACREQGHAMATLDPLSVSLFMHADGAQAWVDGAPFGPRDADAVVPRIGTSLTDQGCAVVAQFEAMGMPVLNRSDAILRARDKLRSLQVLAAQRIPMPRTAVVRSLVDLDDALDQVGGLPCVLKLLKGTQGIGVMLAESRESMESTLQAFWSLGHAVLLQELVEESRGRDVRAFVVGGQVVAAMRREAKVGEFRSNIHRGGRGVPVRLGPEDEREVLRAASAMGLEVAGVDYLESAAGPKVIEVNASPGFEGLEAATGADVAGAVVRRAAQLASGGG
jgi:ribosomal protein S6--L-glutamate ligase